MPTLNAPAPVLSLPKDAKTRVSLADYRGRKVIVAFVPGAFTGVCTKEVCSFRDASADLAGLGADVIVVSVDAPFSNQAWAAQNALPFPVLSDYGREAVRAWDVAHENFAGLQGYTAAKRSVFVVDGEGVLRWQWVAPNPGTEPDYAEVQKAVAAV